MKTILEMAREAGFMKTVQGGAEVSMASMDCLERFAAIVADAEAKRIYDEGMVTVGHMRERIAAEREAIIQEIPGGYSVDPQWVCDMIRARGQA